MSTKRTVYWLIKKGKLCWEVALVPDSVQESSRSAGRYANNHGEGARSARPGQRRRVRVSAQLVRERASDTCYVCMASWVCVRVSGVGDIRSLDSCRRTPGRVSDRARGESIQSVDQRA